METKTLKNYIIPAVISLIAGCIMPFAFAPYHLFILAPFTLALLFYFWLNTEAPLQAALQGFLFGIGMFSVGSSWVYISIYRFGGFPIIISLGVTVIFILILAIFPAIQGYCLARFYRQHKLTKLLFAFPAGWVLLEWVRDWIFTGFPWLYLGYSQTTYPLGGYAPILGIYGVSFLVALTASLLVVIVRYKCWIRYLALLVLIAIWVGGASLNKIHWTQPAKQATTVSIIQGNIPQSIKWEPQKILPTIDLYQRLSEKSLNSQIIIWPEAAVTLPLRLARPYLNSLILAVKRQHTSLIIGIPIQAGKYSFYNAAIVLGNGHGVYYKRHLVPFGEYLPFEYWLLHHFTRILINKFDIPIPLSTSGPGKQQLLAAQDILIAPYICYEVAFTELVRHDLPKAQLLITMSDDAWFGDSFAAAQHLQIGQFRSLETGRYMLFATNNGISAIINAKGKIIKTIPRFKTDILTGKFYAMNGATPWIYIGSWPIIIGLLILLFIPFLLQYREKKCR